MNDDLACTEESLFMNFPIYIVCWQRLNVFQSARGKYPLKDIYMVSVFGYPWSTHLQPHQQLPTRPHIINMGFTGGKEYGQFYDD